MKRSDGAARTLAHEVLHDCGLEDIYTVENPDSSDPNPIPGMASRERLPDDWGGGYYQPGLTQRSLVTRLIMRSGGFSPVPPHTYSVCLPRGPVYGWRYADGASTKTLGHAGVGQNAIRRDPGSH